MSARELAPASRRGTSVARLLVGVAVAGSAACAQGAGESDTPPPRTAESPTPEAAFRATLGRTWSLVRLGEREVPAPAGGAAPARPGEQPGSGSRPTIRFTSESGAMLSREASALSAGGRSFCNGYGTAYILGPGDQLRFQGFQSTLVGCDGPDSLETRFFGALAATQRFALDSSPPGATLELIAADGSRLTFVAAPGAAPPGR